MFKNRRIQSARRGGFKGGSDVSGEGLDSAYLIWECFCDGAGARHLIKGSLKTWHVYIDVASPPSLAPHLDIFVIQHLFKPHRIRARFGSESFVEP